MIGSWAIQKQIEVSYTRFFNDDKLPDLDSFDCLFVMGGPMGVYDASKYSWLSAEKKAIEQAIKGGKKIVGICLGAQLIADVLGAKVKKNNFKEIGWHHVFRIYSLKDPSFLDEAPSSFPAFHWHGDMFNTPAGASHCFRSQGCSNQGFVYDDRVLGLQFHLEMGEEHIKTIIKNCKEELMEGPYIQTETQILRDIKNLSKNSYMIMSSLLDRLIVQGI